MSARKAKAARRAQRADLGVTKQFERSCTEFERTAAQRLAQVHAKLDEPIERLDGRRRALASIVLALFGAAALGCILAALTGGR